MYYQRLTEREHRRNEVGRGATLCTRSAISDLSHAFSHTVIATSRTYSVITLFAPLQAILFAPFPTMTTHLMALPLRSKRLKRIQNTLDKNI